MALGAGAGRSLCVCPEYIILILLRMELEFSLRDGSSLAASSLEERSTDPNIEPKVNNESCDSNRDE
jgi:hypothetical protein